MDLVFLSFQGQGTQTTDSDAKSISEMSEKVWFIVEPFSTPLSNLPWLALQMLCDDQHRRCHEVTPDSSDTRD